MKALRDPLLWLVALFVALLFLMPHSAALFNALFPGLPRPVYQQESFINLALAHLWLVALLPLLSGCESQAILVKKDDAYFAPPKTEAPHTGQRCWAACRACSTTSSKARSRWMLASETSTRTASFSLVAVTQNSGRRW